MSTPHPEGLRRAAGDATTRWRAPASTPTTSATSTCTAPRARRTTRSRRARSPTLFPGAQHASSTKGWTGHTLGAAGSSKPSIALLALRARPAARHAQQRRRSMPPAARRSASTTRERAIAHRDEQFVRLRRQQLLARVRRGGVHDASLARQHVCIEGIGFWAPRLPGWDVARAVFAASRPRRRRRLASRAGSCLRRTSVAARPTPSRSRSRSQRAAVRCGRTRAGELPSVFASTHGDLAITDYMCTTLVATPALISPTKFHNSVHNAAAGYWTIGTSCHAPYTAISAFHHTFGAGLLETAVQIACEQQPVLYVAFDVEAKRRTVDDGAESRPAWRGARARTGRVGAPGRSTSADRALPRTSCARRRRRARPPRASWPTMRSRRCMPLFGSAGLPMHPRLRCLLTLRRAHEH